VCVCVWVGGRGGHLHLLYCKTYQSNDDVSVLAPLKLISLLYICFVSYRPEFPEQ